MHLPEIELDWVARKPPIADAHLRWTPETFQVSEILPVEPQNGDYAWVYVAHQHSTLTLRDKIAESCAIPPSEIRWSGRKDNNAAVKQWISIRRSHVENIQKHVKVLDIQQANRHLRLGEHSANQFALVLDIETSLASGTWGEVASQMVSHGFPNYYGPQRFGAHGVNAIDGLSQLHGNASSGQKERRRFLDNCWQSYGYNHVLSTWLQNGEPEDVDDIVRHPKSNVFLPRSAAPKGDMTGPLFGTQSTVTASEQHILESVLHKSKDELITYCKKARLFGTRRHLLAYPQTLKIVQEGKHLVVDVTLGPGEYASSLVQELFGRHALASVCA